MLRREVRQQPRHDGGRRRREADEPHASGAQAPQLGELAGCGIQRRRHGGCVTREDPPRLGQPHRPADALDEGDAQPLLEALELLADGGLAVAERGGGAGDRPLVGDGLHDPQRLHVEVELVVEHVVHDSIISERHAFACNTCRRREVSSVASPWRHAHRPRHQPRSRRPRGRSSPAVAATSPRAPWDSPRARVAPR